MPRLVKGAKWIFGWVIVDVNNEIPIPKEAWEEYRFKAGEQAFFTQGSKKSGGFGISNQRLLKKSNQKKGISLKIVAEGIFTDEKVKLPDELNFKPGHKLITARGSGFALGIIAQGPIYDEALKHSKIEIYKN